MNVGQPTDMRSLNLTELLTLIRQNTGFVLRRSTSQERLIEIAQGGQPLQEEVAGTSESRLKLQIFIAANMDWLSSQLPCKGENRGVCTKYPCPEGRHLDCFMAASKADI